MSALEKQVSGTHYKEMKIQPIEFIHANNIPFAEANVIKYVTRWKSKNGIADLEKAKHYIELLIELESKKEKTGQTANSWITWEGGDNPVPGHKVEFLIRAQRHEVTPVPRANYSNSLTWKHGDRETDIVKYRVVA